MAGKDGKLTVDISGYNVNTPVRQQGEVFPYRFYAAFNSLCWKESDLRKPCPKCGNRCVIHLGSFLSCDIWYNVFACEKCEIAWCIWDQSDKITKKPGAVRNLEEKKQLLDMFLRRGGDPIAPEEKHIVTTIHGAKGREANHVFLFTDRTRRISREATPENEARVFYVGATRAKKNLFIVPGPEGQFNYELP